MRRSSPQEEEEKTGSWRSHVHREQAFAGGGQAHHRGPAVAGVPPYLLLHVYLLREHGIRVRPTADALMFDMPAVASASSVTTVCNTIEILVHVLAHEAFEEVIDAW